MRRQPAGSSLGGCKRFDSTLAKSPHGLDEIHRVLSSSIIGATDTEVVGVLHTALPGNRHLSG